MGDGANLTRESNRVDASASSATEPQAVLSRVASITTGGRLHRPGVEHPSGRQRLGDSRRAARRAECLPEVQGRSAQDVTFSETGQDKTWRGAARHLGAPVVGSSAPKLRIRLGLVIQGQPQAARRVLRRCEQIALRPPVGRGGLLAERGGQEIHRAHRRSQIGGWSTLYLACPGQKLNTRGFSKSSRCTL